MMSADEARAATKTISEVAKKTTDDFLSVSVRDEVETACRNAKTSVTIQFKLGQPFYGAETKLTELGYVVTVTEFDNYRQLKLEW